MRAAMITAATSYDIELIIGGIGLTVLGILLIRNGLRQIDTGGTDRDKRELLESRMFMTINMVQSLLGMPEKRRLTRAEVRTFGWSELVLGIIALVVGVWNLLEVFRRALNAGS